MEKQQSAKPVVGAVKMPKIKLAGDKAAAVNAFAVAFAAFFGFVAIFAAIAGFTSGDWSFGVPLLGIVVANVSVGALTLITAVLAAVFGVVGMMTLGKITDAKALAKSWQCVAKVFFVLAAIYVVTMVSLAIYSLLGAGAKGLDQGALWLSSFLPNLITAVAAGVMGCIARQIANGKTAMLRMLSFAAVGIAGVALILVIIQTLVGFYGSKTSSGYGKDYGDYDYSNLLDLFR
jgi:hypothetical protein